MEISPKKITKWGCVAFFILLAILAGFFLWAETPLGPQARARQDLTSSSAVNIENGKWISVTPTNMNPSTGLILYPGGRVDPVSYLTVARDIAEKGYQVVIVPMPLNLAVFSPEAADQVIAAYPDIEHWAVGGHSLGGAMAARYAARNSSLVKGLVLWAAYPASSDDLSKDDLKVVSIFGTADGLATKDKIDASRLLLPGDTHWYPIEGGNHAQFGAYGEQPGDNPAQISPEEQQAKIIQATVDLLASLE
jgi:hypothetical protein